MKRIKTIMIGILIAISMSVLLIGCGKDTVFPEITGTAQVELNVGSTFDIYAGVTAADKDNDGEATDITSNIRVDLPSGVEVQEGKVVFKQGGIYVFTYRVSDSAGNTSAVNRTIIVKEIINDTVAPVIIGADNLDIGLSDELFDIYAGVTATDKDNSGKTTDITSNIRVDLPSGVEITDRKVVFNQSGLYVFTYRVSDAVGNEAAVNRTIIVKEIINDTVAPVIVGADNLDIGLSDELFDIYVGVTAIDKDNSGKATDITSNIRVDLPSGVDVTDGKVVFRQSGLYVFTYRVSDAVGNEAAVNRIVSVREEVNDTEAPVISGVDNIRIDLISEEFDIYNGVTAIDSNGEGNFTVLSDRIEVACPADVSVENNVAKFPKAGDYIFTYRAQDDAGNVATVNRKVEVRNIYNLYWVSATVPVLYCALDMVQNNYKSMLVFSRSDTIDITALDSDRFIYVVNGCSDTEELVKAQNMTANIAHNDPYSYFRLFACDASAQMDIFTFPLYGINSDRYEVKYLSDGTWTYSVPYRTEGSISVWNQNKAIYDEIFANALLGNVSVTGTERTLHAGTFSILNNVYSNKDMHDMSLIAAQRDNVEIWCAYPETITSEDSDIQKELAKVHMPKMNPATIWESFSEEQRNEFLKIINFDKKTFDETYFDKEGEYLIVTGTNPVTGSLSENEFKLVLEKIIAAYPNTNILFKPHPSAIPSEDNCPAIYKLLNDNNIKILPGRLPMEAISWVYSNVHIGGFESSLFMAVPQGNVDFFIAENNTLSSDVIKQLFDDGAFGEVKYFWK